MRLMGDLESELLGDDGSLLMGGLGDGLSLVGYWIDIFWLFIGWLGIIEVGLIELVWEMYWF